ncbi:hypothetical protein GCM10029978_103770 [Actinoallomurus acanthiterrae]
MGMGAHVGEMLDIMRRTKIRASSPDKSLAIIVSGMPANIKVEIAPGAHARHSERSFEQQVNAAIRVAMVGYQQVAMKAWRKAAKVPEPESAAGSLVERPRRGGDAGERRRLFIEE